VAQDFGGKIKEEKWKTGFMQEECTLFGYSFHHDSTVEFLFLPLPCALAYPSTHQCIHPFTRPMLPA
jgi:hypothetical protein